MTTPAQPEQEIPGAVKPEGEEDTVAEDLDEEFDEDEEPADEEEEEVEP